MQNKDYRLSPRIQKLVNELQMNKNSNGVYQLPFEKVCAWNENNNMQVAYAIDKETLAYRLKNRKEIMIIVHFAR